MMTRDADSDAVIISLPSILRLSSLPGPPNQRVGVIFALQESYFVGKYALVKRSYRFVQLLSPEESQ